MTQDEIRKLLGGYATNALTANERQILFEAALEDQELFNALQNEDALRELLDDPVSREQVRRALQPSEPSEKPSTLRIAPLAARSGDTRGGCRDPDRDHEPV